MSKGLSPGLDSG